MKKLLALFLCVLALFSLSACTTQADVEAAYQRGYKNGYEEGRSDGRRDGYDEGYSDGYVRCPVDPYDYEQAYEAFHSALLNVENWYFEGEPYDIGKIYTWLEMAQPVFYDLLDFMYSNW